MTAGTALRWLQPLLLIRLRHLLPTGFLYLVCTPLQWVWRVRTDSLAGVDSEELSWGKEGDTAASGNAQAHVKPTIEEDKLAEVDEGSPRSPPFTPRHVKRNSYQRLSRLSDEARLSIQSISLTPGSRDTDSNRSSATIRGTQFHGSGGLNDVDFDRALRKFASERDSFLSDLTLSAGAVVPNRPKPRPKTQRIANEEAASLKSGGGSLRRRISFRDMNSVKKQTSIARQGKHQPISPLFIIPRQWSHTCCTFRDNEKCNDRSTLTAVAR